jgi:hypothetical protein
VLAGSLVGGLGVREVGRIAGPKEFWPPSEILFLSSLEVVRPSLGVGGPSLIKFYSTMRVGGPSLGDWRSIDEPAVSIDGGISVIDDSFSAIEAPLSIINDGYGLLWYGRGMG